MSELKENFLSEVVRGDYLPNAVGVPLSHIQGCVADNALEDILPEDWTLPMFYEQYKNGGAKGWLLKGWVVKNLPGQFAKAVEVSPENTEADCLKIVENIPELKECLEYADYLRNMFQRKIDNIRGRLSTETNESLAKELGNLLNDFNELRQTTRFDPEKDPEYEKQKEVIEASPKPPTDRR